MTKTRASIKFRTQRTFKPFSFIIQKEIEELAFDYEMMSNFGTKWHDGL